MDMAEHGGVQGLQFLRVGPRRCPEVMPSMEPGKPANCPPAPAMSHEHPISWVTMTRPQPGPSDGHMPTLACLPFPLCLNTAAVLPASGLPGLSGSP